MLKNRSYGQSVGSPFRSWNSIAGPPPKQRCGCQVFTGNGTGFYRIVRLRQGEEMFLLFFLTVSGSLNIVSFKL